MFQDFEIQDNDDSANPFSVVDKVCGFALLFVLDHVCLVRLQANKDTFPQFPIVNMVVDLCAKLEPMWTLNGIIRTTREHALNKIGDVAKDNAESLWTTLLTSDGLNLHTLQDRLGSAWIAFEDGAVEHESAVSR